MEELTALAEQHAELRGVLAGLAPEGWRAATRCDGWDVADVVLHLAQTDEMATGSADGTYSDVLARLTAGIGWTANVDEGADRMVAGERGLAVDALLARWTSGTQRLRAALGTAGPSTRVPWVAGQIAVRTLTTTRLAETWIHTGDVADAVGASLVPGDRLRLIARLAWRTLPYAFGRAGRSLGGPVAFHLTSPAGEAWDFDPPEPVATTITGPATDLCNVAARRVLPSSTALHAAGPDGDAVLDLVRTYA